MRGYGQFCPLARAAEILCERWTLLIVRELLYGSERFNAIHRGVPLISRTVLSERLATLRAAGVVSRGREGGYRLTESGWALLPIVMSLARWGDEWIQDEFRREHLDVGLLMWDMRRNLRIDALPRRHGVIALTFTDAPKGKRRWGLVIEPGSVALCLNDPGFEPDLWLTMDVRTLTEAWVGHRDLRRALERGDIRTHGDRELARSLPRWLPGSPATQHRRDEAGHAPSA